MQHNLSGNQPVPLSKAQLFFSLLYGQKMNLFPKRYGSPSKGDKNAYDKDRQWVFFGTKEQMKCVATQATLFAILADPGVDTTYYTPNGYYKRDRLTETLRWLNAFVFDIDDPGLSLVDVFDRIHNAGLNRPTAIIQTPSGGYHVAYFFREPVRATDKAVRLYSAIMWHMADDLGADMAAVGANRIFRTPTEHNLVYFDQSNTYNFDAFKEWRDINHPYDPSRSGHNIQAGDIMNHPALQYLLTSTCGYGSRDVVAFNLALAMKASNWSLEQAESALREWFISCCVKGGQEGKKPFTERDAVYKAKYVYRNSNLYAPKAEIIRRLSGMPFFYQSRSNWLGSKPRDERVRVHLHEWEDDLLALLRSVKKLSGTQQELADRLKCPLTSFRAIVRKMKADGRILVTATRGRGGMTVIRLPELVEYPVDQPSRSDSIVIPLNQIDSIKDKKPERVIIYADFIAKAILHIESIPETDDDPPDPRPPD